MLSLPGGEAALLHDPSSVLVDAPGVVGDDVVERHASELFLGVAQRLPERGVGPHEPPGFDVDQGDVLRRLLDHRAVELLALADSLFRLLALDGRAQSVGRGLQRVDLGDRPLALGEALVEPDDSPPLPFDEDRHDRNRQDVLLAEHGLIFLRELPRVAVYQLSPA